MSNTNKTKRKTGGRGHKPSKRAHLAPRTTMSVGPTGFGAGNPVMSPKLGGGRRKSSRRKYRKH